MPSVSASVNILSSHPILEEDALKATFLTLFLLNSLLPPIGYSAIISPSDDNPSKGKAVPVTGRESP
jgi:hypothetical protein